MILSLHRSSNRKKITAGESRRGFLRIDRQKPAGVPYSKVRSRKAEKERHLTSREKKKMQKPVRYRPSRLS